VQSTVKNILLDLVNTAVQSVAPDLALPPLQIERCRDPRHGDFASNAALVLAKPLGKAPRAVAEALRAALPPDPRVASVEIAGPGFLNFTLTPAATLGVVLDILAAGDAWGRARSASGERVQVEFVSANPTGPLHIGHGRGAAYGAALADLLEAAGHRVEREYYVNDAGRQMDILALSVWLRYLTLLGTPLAFPPNAYQGDYVIDIARALHEREGNRLACTGEEPLLTTTADETERESHLDALIELARNRLGEEDYRIVHAAGLEAILADIREDLREFGVEFQCWYSERSLTDSGAVDRALARLEAGGHLYRKDGALWFRSSAFGDEKDRVVERENGQRTYFASDIAYHAEKLERGYDRVINIWGADHHGYIPRVTAALEALGYPAGKLEVQLVQFATLYRGGQRAQMSTRSGEFVTLRELREDVGNDAARFFYVMRRSDQHLDFDLDLATSESSDNPVYYAQYAHARICSVFRQWQEAHPGEVWQPVAEAAALAPLVEPEESTLISELGRYPDVVAGAARAREPHQIANYLREVAAALHAWYNRHKFLGVEPHGLEAARLTLAAATGQVLGNALRLLGVAAPERM
jgi:arginyl-tRNA synthetase